MATVRTMLIFSDREEISRGLAKGVAYKEIAHMRCDPSVISRDVRGHGGGGYRATTADKVACAACERPIHGCLGDAPMDRHVLHRMIRS